MGTEAPSELGEGDAEIGRLVLLLFLLEGLAHFALEGGLLLVGAFLGFGVGLFLLFFCWNWAKPVLGNLEAVVFASLGLGRLDIDAPFVEFGGCFLDCGFVSFGLLTVTTTEEFFVAVLACEDEVFEREGWGE